MQFRAESLSSIGTPLDPLVYEISQISGVYNQQSAQFDLLVDSGNTVGQAVQVRFVMDFDGDGVTDGLKHAIILQQILLLQNLNIILKAES